MYRIEVALVQHLPSKLKQIRGCWARHERNRVLPSSVLKAKSPIPAIAIWLGFEACTLNYEMQAMIEDAAIQHIFNVWQTWDSNE